MNDVYRHAVRLLQRGLLSRAELYRRLLKRQYPKPEIEATLAELVRLGFIDDARLAADRAAIGAGNKFGRHKVQRKLRAAGIDSQVARRSVDQAFADTDERATACELLLRKLPGWSTLEPGARYRRAVGMLRRRGFGSDVIRSAIADALRIDQELDDVPESPSV
jgi:regulatory protein